MLIIFQKKCVELKSLKNYMWSFRDVGAFHEKVTNDIHSELKKLLSPSFIRVSSDFFVRGGISTKIVCEYKEKNLTIKSHLKYQSILMNEILSILKPYPFEKLNKLLKETSPKIKNKIDFSIGEPKHAIPKSIIKNINNHVSLWSYYPKTKQSEELVLQF